MSLISAADEPGEAASAAEAAIPATPTAVLRVSIPWAWSQTDDNLSVLVPCPTNFSKNDAKVDVTEDALSVSFSGEPAPRVLGKLWGRVDRFSALWQVESDRGLRLLTLHLDKEQAERWPLLIAGPVEEGAMDAHSCFVLAQAARESGDMEKAVALFRQAAERNHVEAMMTLAAFLLLGDEGPTKTGVAKDHEAAIELYKRCAAAGSIEAMYVLGGLHQQGIEDKNGNAGEPDYPMALHWFDKAVAMPGARERSRELYVSAAFQAGLLCFEGGHGLGPADPAKALSYWRYAIEGGSPQAMYNAAVLFLNGAGTDRDLGRAGRLFAAAKLLDSNLLPPADIAKYDRDQMDKLAELDSRLKAQGESLPLYELIARYEAEASLQKPRPRKKKVASKTKKAKEDGGVSYVNIALVAAALVGAALLVRRYWWSRAPE
ncbi:hypothetical protein DFJ74DRAFT_657655 [Hyaloraphidium curvatum]|nr:hypothetical protein DFJ74DRAFT_657655 [Hyaloraphidium curvatum]